MKPTLDELDVKAMIQHIIDNKHEPSLNYAVNYAIAAQHMSGHELYVQCLYIKNNITGWRGPLAKQVRAALTAYIKEHGR
jgi:hypothetical protein